MIEMVNAILHCVVTGLFTALFLTFFSWTGLLPFVVIFNEDDTEEEDEE